MTVRKYEFDEKEYNEEKEKRGRLTTEIQTKETDLKKNCEIVYSALFECLLHLKVLRAHIECVLRWGVPPKYFISAIKVRISYDIVDAVWKGKEDDSKLDKALYTK